MLFRLKKTLMLFVSLLIVCPIWAIDLNRLNIDFDFFADEDGAEKVYFTVCVPVQDRDKNPIVQGDIKKIDVYRKYENFAFTIEDPVPGEIYGQIDEGVEQGVTYTYYIIATDKNGKTRNYQSFALAYVGFDVPSQVWGCTATSDGRNVRLKWDAPTAGEHNGKFNAYELSYDIYRVSSGKETLVAENFKKTEYTDTPVVDEITGLKYNIIAKTNAGPSRSSLTKRVLVGESHKTPFIESFAGGIPEHDTWITDDLWEYSDQYSNTKSVDGDGGMLTTTLYSSSSSYSISSSPISLAGLKVPMLEFSYYAQANRLDCSIEVEATAGDKTETIGSVDFSGDKKEWKTVHFPLNEFVGGAPVTITFIVKANESNEFAIDKISVNDFFDHNLCVKDVKVPAKVNSGEDIEVRVSVVNNGLNMSEAYKVDVLRNGTKIETIEDDELASGATKIFTITDNINNTIGNTVKYEARITYDADENNDDNVKTSSPMTVALATLPIVESLNGEDGVGKKITLSWSTPNIPVVADINETESFEDAENYSITAPGDWTFYDGDGQKSYPLFEKGLKSSIKLYDNIYTPKAFQIVDTEESIDPNTTYPWKAYSGNKVLVALSPYYGAQNDWLISPELSGDAQTISFYTLAYNDLWGTEQIFVYASKYGTDVNDDFDTANPLLSGKDAETGYEITNTIINRASYKKIEVNLPKGTRHFAIRVATPANDGFLLIDNVSYQAARTDIPVHLLGYNIYCDDVKLNEVPVTECSYMAENDGKTHSYTVKAVYAEGEAEASSAYRSGMSSIEDIIANSDESPIIIYDLYGRILKTAASIMDLESLPAGVYIVNGQKVAYRR